MYAQGMTDRVKLPLNFDAQLLLEDIARFKTNDWIEHFVKQNYEGDWSVIPLRGPTGATHPVMMIYSDPTCKDFSDTPYLQELDYIPSVLNEFKCPLLAVRLMKLSPGSRIKEHTDHDLAFENGVVRIHIPVQTNNHVEFLLNGEAVDFNAGDCWYLKLNDPHSVNNIGNTDRIHLVIDALVNDWLSQLLHQA